MTAQATAFLYCHGIPGSAAELNLFDCRTDDVHSLDRIAAATAGPRWIHHLADQAIAIAGDRPIRLIGFSLGGHAALRMATILGPSLASIDLIAPAAPLETGDYLEQMAGGAIFRIARDRPSLFSAVVAAQAAAAWIAPGPLIRQLLSSAAAADRALAEDPVFRRRLGACVRQSLGVGRQSYRQEILTYVQPWADVLPSVQTPVTLWHGQSDNWSPPTMTEALAERLPRLGEVHRLAGMSHYSTLHAALPRIRDRYALRAACSIPSADDGSPLKSP